MHSRNSAPRCFGFLRFALALLLVVFTVSNLSLAQVPVPVPVPQYPYRPSGTIPADPLKFPLGSDRRVGAQALDSMQLFNQYIFLGDDVQTFVNWRDQTTGAFRESFNWTHHDWKCGNPMTELDWQMDSRRMLYDLSLNPAGRFRRCFTPKVTRDAQLGFRPAIHLSHSWTVVVWGVPVRFTLHSYGPDPLKNCVRGNGFGLNCSDDGEADEDGNSLVSQILFEEDPMCCVANKDIMDICDIDRYGYHLEMLWPSEQVSINNYGISAFDPTYECGNTGYRHNNIDAGPDILNRQWYNTYLIARFVALHLVNPLLIPDRLLRGNLRTNPHTGKTHWGGMLPEDQTYVQEAHAYRSYLAHMAMLNLPSDTEHGYEEDLHCFYNAVETRPRRIVTGWTENVPHLPIWRTEELSRSIDGAMYRLATPAVLRPAERFSKATYYGSLDPRFPAEKSCAAYRAGRWPVNIDLGIPMNLNTSGYLEARENYYGDLVTALGVVPMSAFVLPSPAGYNSDGLFVGTTDQVNYSRQCFRGGGELYPLTGRLSGFFSELPASAYLARRAVELFEQLGLNPNVTRMNFYSDNFDKMQRLYPLTPPGSITADVSSCFRTQEIPNYLKPTLPGNYSREGDENWPKNAIRPDQHGEKRFAIWERKRVCMCPKVGRAMAFKLQVYGRITLYTHCQRMGDACMSANDGDWGVGEIVWRTDGMSPGYAIPGIRGPRTDVNLLTGLPEGVPYPFFDNRNLSHPNKPRWCPQSQHIPYVTGSLCGLEQSIADALPGVGGGGYPSRSEVEQAQNDIMNGIADDFVRQEEERLRPTPTPVETPDPTVEPTPDLQLP